MMRVRRMTFIMTNRLFFTVHGLLGDGESLWVAIVQQKAGRIWSNKLVDSKPVHTRKSQVNFIELI